MHEIVIGAPDRSANDAAELPAADGILRSAVRSEPAIKWKRVHRVRPKIVRPVEIHRALVRTIVVLVLDSQVVAGPEIADSDAIALLHV